MNKYLNFKNKVSVITGAGSGIGREVAIKLSNLGSIVILVGRSNKVLKVERKINKRNVISYVCDLSNESSVENLYKKIIKKFKKVDILVNSAGVTASGDIDNISSKGWQDINDNNGLNTFLCCKYFSKSMKKRKKGKIVNVSSIAGRFRGRTSGLHYAYAKSGLIGFTRQLGAELAKWNINVNCFCPSQTMTDMLKSLITPKIKKELEKTIPIKRIATPQEQADVILFLVSEMSNYVAGAAIDSNGGQF
jgi:NAD(P)-dependent dehydrogenase (short-subunit alcohol dehydrogenase family)|tara:strand:+ start:4171 stop:4917 length:747 start_codon:yes stop_codon:yes gene_type:complete